MAQTTVLLGHPHWTVVKKVRSTFISFKKHIWQGVKLDLLDLAAMIYLPTIDSAGGGGSSTSSPCDPANDDRSCCTSSSPCSLGEGDCDSDSHCAGDLVCGTDNCAAGSPSLDCCEEGKENSH